MTKDKRNGDIMLTIKEVDSNGTTKELTFSSKAEAAEAIRTFFDFEKSERQMELERRQALNDDLRRQWSQGRMIGDPQELFDRARKNL
jgi:hypothetical protein